MHKRSGDKCSSVFVPLREGVYGRHQFSAVSDAFTEQSINHLSSATVETFILDPCHGLPVGPPFQCSAVMLFNWKHNNHYYYWRQRNRHLASVHSYCFASLPVGGGLSVAMLWWLKTGLQAHTMGRPGAAHVPAGWPCPVASYFAIVNILGDGGEVSLTVILRGYLYGETPIKGVMGLQRKAQPPKGSTADSCCHLATTNAHRKSNCTS